MDAKNKLYYLIKLLKLTFPVRIKVKVEALTYISVDIHGKEVLEGSTFSGTIDWEQVKQNYLKESKGFNFCTNDESVNVYFTIQTISDIPQQEFLFTYLDAFSKAMDEVRRLTAETITFEDLYDIRQIIIHKKNSRLVKQMLSHGITFELELPIEIANDIPSWLQIAEDGIPSLVTQYLILHYLKQECKDIPKLMERLDALLTEKMIEIPQVRLTQFMADYIDSDKLESFKKLEDYLMYIGKLDKEYQFKGTKFEAVSLLYALGDYGYIRKTNETVQGYKAKARYAFEEHYGYTDEKRLSEQIKPSKYEDNKVSLRELGIEDWLKNDGRTKTKNPFLKES